MPVVVSTEPHNSISLEDHLSLVRKLHAKAIENLNFIRNREKLLVASARISFSPEDLTDSIKMKLQKWRNGAKPFVVEKVARIQEFISELYPKESKT